MLTEATAASYLDGRKKIILLIGEEWITVPGGSRTCKTTMSSFMYGQRGTCSASWSRVKFWYGYRLSVLENAIYRLKYWTNVQNYVVSKRGHSRMMIVLRGSGRALFIWINRSAVALINNVVNGFNKFSHIPLNVVVLSPSSGWSDVNVQLRIFLFIIVKVFLIFYRCCISWSIPPATTVHQSHVFNVSYYLHVRIHRLRRTGPLAN